MKFCRFCGSRLEEESSVCPQCGKDLTIIETSVINNKKEVIHSHKKVITKKTVLIILLVICAIIIVMSMMPKKCKRNNCDNLAVSSGDYCYSHKCSLCDEEKYLYSNYCYSHYLLYDEDANKPSVYSYQLKVSNVNITTSKYYTKASGNFTNNSDTTVKFVKIKGSFKNSSGKVVDTDWTYAVGSEGLKPGETCKWELSVDKDYSIKSCSAEVIDYDY